MMNFDRLLSEISNYPVKKVAVAAAQDHTVIKACVRARKERIAEAVLLGDEALIRQTSESHGIDLSGVSIEHQDDDIKSAHRAVDMVVNGEADLVMKGYIHTDDFLRAVLRRERGLRTGVLMSHVFVAEFPGRDRFLMVTDGAMNIAPDLEQKAMIVLNAVHLAHALRFDEPRVAALAAVELLNPVMNATVDATCLSTMSQRRQFSPKCVIDGPFALDNAVSEIAAQHKRIGGPVAGRADILLTPDIEAGNMLAKSLVYFAQARLAGIVVGASHPVVLTSRADSDESKFLSIALGVYFSSIERHLKLKIGKVHY
jgi:phosphate butyryltransferase